MIQQDLAKLGMKVNIVTLDFPSLIDRMTRTLNYEACLLGLVNIDPDPSHLMNVLLSSASNHPWNPSQKKPETDWEADIVQKFRNDPGTREVSGERDSPMGRSLWRASTRRVVTCTWWPR